MPVSTLEANPNVKYAVSAIAVNGTIELDPSSVQVAPATGQPTSSTETNYVDYYTFTGKAGDLMNFQVLSNTLSRTVNAIDPVVSLYDPTGKLIASNDDDFESLDPSLVDQVLPMDGKYTVEVSDVNLNQSGTYTLFLYRFAKGEDVSGPGSGSTLVGGSGSDQFIQDSGTDDVTPGASMTTVSLKIFSGTQQVTGPYQIEGGQTVQLMAVGYSSTYHDQLTYSLAPVPDGKGGSLAYPTGVTIDATTGAIQWPTADASGAYFVQVTVTSGADGETASTNLKIDVETGPTANAQTVNVAENSTTDPIALTATDPMNLSLTYSFQYSGSGSLVQSGNGPMLTYTPANGFVGQDSFTFTAMNADGAASAPATVTINVAAPPTAQTQTVTFAENSSNDTITVRATDSNSPSQTPLTYAIVQTVGHGTLTQSSSGSASFTYTPTSGYYGADSFTFTATNQAGATSSAATVSITVSPTAPTANDDSYSNVPHKNLTLTVKAPGVLANDTDPNGLTLTAVSFSKPSHGSLTPDSNGDGGFVYTPNHGYTGPDSFTYQAGDGVAISNTATVNLTVVDDAPTAVNDNYSVTEDGTLSVNAANGVLANDSDPNGDTLTAVSFSTPAHGSLAPDSNGDGGFVYTPNSGYFGSDSFTYQASDGSLTSANATVSLTVNALAPTANNDTYSNVPHDRTYSGNSVLANDTANKNDSLSASVVGNVSHGSLTLNTNGTFSYTPSAAYLGSDSFTYKVHDATNNTDSNTATVSLTVVDPNPPVAVADNYSVSENGTLTVPAANGVLSNDSDADRGDTLTAVLVSQPSHGTLTMDSNGDGGFVYTPNSGYFGSDSFTYKASDEAP